MEAGEHKLLNEVITVRLFKRKEKRAADGTVGIEDCLLSAMLGGNIEVTKAEALQIPTVAACVNLIADRISALPIKLYRENGKKVEEITDDKRLCLLNHDTGDTINASEMKKLWVRDYFLGKGSYTYIERNMYNEPTGLYYVDETRVAIAPNADPIHKTFAINVNGHVYFPYQFLKILRNSKGFGVGTSILAEDPLALAIFYNTMKFENATIRKGGNKKGYILSKNKLTQDALDKVKEAWRKLYSNSYDTKDNAVVLNDGLDFKESSSTSVELQLNENKRTNAEEICKLFCMPADVLNGKANESMISQFVQNCLMPLINTIESALDRDMLTEAEKIGHYYWAFDTSELTRGDFASRMNAYAVALQNNIYQLDEIREMEDKPPLGFNFIKLGLDAVLVDPETREIYTPNTGRLEKMNAEHLTDEQLRAILEERYNPYHDPVTGQFTTGNMAGWSSGAALVVEKGEKGAGKYVFNSELASSEPSANKIHFVPASSIDEARKYAKDKLGIDTSNYGNVNLDVANMINKEITEVYNTFGNLNQSGDLNEILIVSGAGRASNWAGGYAPAMKSILLKESEVRYKNSIKRLKSDAEYEFKMGFHSSDSAEHTIRHELGHAVQHMITDQKAGNPFGNSVQKLKDIESIRTSLAVNLGMTSWSMNATPSEMKAAGKHLSYYGMRNTGEFIAESVAEYMAGNPRPVAKQVVDILLRKE